MSQEQDAVNTEHAFCFLCIGDRDALPRAMRCGEGGEEEKKAETSHRLVTNYRTVRTLPLGNSHEIGTGVDFYGAVLGRFGLRLIFGLRR